MGPFSLGEMYNQISRLCYMAKVPDAPEPGPLMMELAPGKMMGLADARRYRGRRPS